jgi:hypothetical protein
MDSFKGSSMPGQNAIKLKERLGIRVFGCVCGFHWDFIPDPSYFFIRGLLILVLMSSTDVVGFGCFKTKSNKRKDEISFAGLPALRRFIEGGFPCRGLPCKECKPTEFVLILAVKVIGYGDEIA